jgi:hypothetical protein
VAGGWRHIFADFVGDKKAKMSQRNLNRVLARAIGFVPLCAIALCQKVAEAISVGYAEVYMLKGLMLHVRNRAVKWAPQTSRDHVGRRGSVEARHFPWLGQRRYPLPRG